MSAAAPWSVKGIDPKAREIAKDLARRQGLTLGDWLNRMILEDTLLPDEGGAASEPAGRPIANEEFGRLREALDRLSTRVESAEHRSTLAISGIDQTVLGLLSRLGRMVFERGEDIYNFRGVHRYKDKYDPVWRPRYIAGPSKWSIPGLLADVGLMSSGGVSGLTRRNRPAAASVSPPPLPRAA